MHVAMCSCTGGKNVRHVDWKVRVAKMDATDCCQQYMQKEGGGKGGAGGRGRMEGQGRGGHKEEGNYPL